MSETENMRAVWTFWSKPFRHSQGHGWREPRHHWLAWALSVSLARQHFDTLQLVTDATARRCSSTGLDCRSTRSRRRSTISPAPIPNGGRSASSSPTACNQNPSSISTRTCFSGSPRRRGSLARPCSRNARNGTLDASWRNIRAIEHAFARHEGRLPVEWTFAASRVTTGFREENCGIVGGVRADFLRHYALTALKMARDPANSAAWAELWTCDDYNMVLEQFLLAACVDYHTINPRSVFRGVEIRYLFPSWERANDMRASSEAGFSHLLGPSAKLDPDVTTRLERRVERLDPTLARRCVEAAL